MLDYTFVAKAPLSTT